MSWNNFSFHILSGKNEIWVNSGYQCQLDTNTPNKDNKELISFASIDE